MLMLKGQLTGGINSSAGSRLGTARLPPAPVPAQSSPLVFVNSSSSPDRHRLLSTDRNEMILWPGHSHSLPLCKMLEAEVGLI